MASEFGLDLLSRSKATIVDGTFDTTECKLTLTTLFGIHDGQGIPCAYLLSNSKEMRNYKSYYEVTMPTIAYHIYLYILADCQGINK